MKKVRWGVLSTAKIARTKVIPAMQRGTHTQVVAIASRSADRARATAASLGIERTHDSYEALLSDPDVDAIYNPLPNHLHVDWSIRALEAGKHVLCEKPIGLDTEDALRLVEAAHRHPHLRVMEAFMYRFHPQWQRTKTLVDDGTLGDLRTIHTTFAYFNTAEDNIRNQVQAGGGALMDIGCYGVSLARFLFDREPARVTGFVERDPQFGTDRLTSALLDFDEGTATVTCSTQMIPHQRVHVLGTRGRIEIEIPFNAPPDAPCRLIVQRGASTDVDETPAVDQYTLQGDALSRAILENTAVPTPLSDAVANMRVIDAVWESEKTGRSVEPGR